VGSRAGAIVLKREPLAVGDGVATAETCESGPGVTGGEEVGGVLPKS
jgi:hypothetical protein